MLPAGIPPPLGMELPAGMRPGMGDVREEREAVGKEEGHLGGAEIWLPAAEPAAASV